ncbi:acyltransferase family protein [Halioxenophilus sp. WMMB6]|uniref:acyltransferase family protein n=1 Tax=Halioxenophilus sp. WMMB6 TaxID=3073815 RepID=UPI00295E5D17|nr:acyltransferase family protein [Halioxenophilus sp. WMMB6]
MSQRIVFIDLLRGVSISLVILGHASFSFNLRSELLADLAMFRMPLFFLISGTVLSLKSSAMQLCVKKADQLLKPYLFTLLALFCADALVRSQASIGGLLGIFYGSRDSIIWQPMWYLTHLWLVFAVVITLVKVFDLPSRSAWVKGAAVLACLATGILTTQLLSPMQVTFDELDFRAETFPFTFESLFISVAFFLAGYFLRDKIATFKTNPWILLASVLVFVVISLRTTAVVDLGSGKYQAPLFALLGGLAGIYFIFCLSQLAVKSKWITTLFVHLGVSSLFLLIFHWYPMQLVFGKLMYLLGSEWKLLAAAITYIACIAIPLLVRQVVLRSPLLQLFYMPVTQFPPRLSLYKKLEKA